MARSLTPEEATVIRVRDETRYEFAVEAGLVDEDERIDRRELTERLLDLTAYERRALDSRMHRNLSRVRSLMADDPQRFDEPHVTHDDLVDDVVLTRLDARSR